MKNTDKMENQMNINSTNRGERSPKTALITGASSGLGIEFAELLAEQRVNLVLAARRREPMEELATRMRERFGIVVHVEPLDLAQIGAAAELKARLAEKGLQVDMLVNNAGYGLHGDFLETPIERTVDMINLNITTLTELTYVFGKDMADRGSGEILLVASLLAFQPVPTYAAYAATKAYVLSFGEALHDELRWRGVTVTSLCPGHTETGFDAVADAHVSPILRALTMRPRPVAEAGLRALSQRKASTIAGVLNNIVAFTNRLTPRSLQRASIKRVMSS